MKKISFLILIMFNIISLYGQKDISDYPIPKNFKQCFNILNKTTKKEIIQLIKTLPEDSIISNKIIDYEMDFDFYWLDEKSKLTRYFDKIGLDSFGRRYSHYEIILISYHRYLNNKGIDIDNQIKKYNSVWKKETEEYQQKQDSVQRQYQLNKMIISSINSYIVSDKNLVKQGFSLADTSRYYICMDGLPADFPYNSVQNATFFSLNNIEGVPDVLKRKLKKGIKTLFVGLKISNNQLVITVAGRGVKRVKKKHISIVMGDWGIFIYEYSCEKQKWELQETKYGGI
jgi:hypothetical protein